MSAPRQPVRLADLGERAMIRRLCARLAERPDVRTGPGDDCAVVRHGREDLLLKSDPLIGGVHFAKTTPPEQIGHKALARVLSDIAAMGGEPLWTLVNVVAPPNLPAATLLRVYRGLNRLARRHGVAVVGGDLARGPVLELHVFAVGRAPAGGAVLRSGARPGDALYVTGALGGSLAGRHLRFPPRLAEGAWLRAGNWARAMIDISDGLATDLHHLCRASGVGAELQAGQIPLAAATRGRKGPRTPLEHALYDGEDFELLFTVPWKRRAAFATAWQSRFRTPCSMIGRCTRRARIVELCQPCGCRMAVPDGGYDHYVRQAISRLK